ncbi:hypothetical protein ABEV74_20580 [Paenibacillus cisolokensis]|uniref:hypothetical protein n=1 Tax=Paenibacillus cisolokensis TaxID=1658519 RepID=UPI003D2D7902
MEKKRLDPEFLAAMKVIATKIGFSSPMMNELLMHIAALEDDIDALMDNVTQLLRELRQVRKEQEDPVRADVRRLIDEWEMSERSFDLATAVAEYVRGKVSEQN